MSDTEDVDLKISDDGRRAGHPVAFQLLRTPAGGRAWSAGLEVNFEHVGIVDTPGELEAWLSGAGPETLPSFRVE